MLSGSAVLFPNLRIKMTGPSSNINLSNDDDKNLEFLLDAFGSVISADDMASAYCQAGRDLHKTTEILYNMLGSSFNNNIPVSTRDLTNQPAFSVGSAGTVSGVNDGNNGRSRNLSNEPMEIPSRHKLRKSGVSMGTVSSVIGADYGVLRASTKVVRETTKPVKLMSNEIPASQIWVEKPKSVEVKTENMEKDVELFLLKMLGDGFQLDTEVIKEVVDGCGYDIRESMEKLLIMSHPTLDLADITSAFVDQTKCTERCEEDLNFNFDEKMKINDSAQRSNLEKELLTSLFTAPERSEVGPRTVLPRRPPRIRKYGLVTEPLEDTETEVRSPIVKKEDNGNGAEDNYEILREAAKEYFVTMNKYYEAAFDAFKKRNLDVAHKLVEQGHFYKAKCREANETSAKMLTQTREDGEVISIDLNDCDPKGAVRLLKVQLKSMCGIPCFHYLKAIVGTNAGKTKPNARKRLVMKLLERDEIPWTEEQDGQIMAIRIDVINPKRLSFNKS